MTYSDYFLEKEKAPSNWTATVNEKAYGKAAHKMRCFLTHSKGGGEWGKDLKILLQIIRTL